MHIFFDDEKYELMDNAQIAVIPAEPLPELKTGEVWSCDSGCETVTPTLQDFVRSEERNPDTMEIIAQTIEQYWGCQCGADIEPWSKDL